MTRSKLPVHGKKTQAIDTTQLLAQLKKIFAFFKEHLVLLFIVITLSALIYAVLAVNTALQQSSIDTQNASSNKYSNQFDQNTINKIDTLNNTNQTPSITLPSGRINPFSE